jgi:serine/threonine protein kinase
MAFELATGDYLFFPEAGDHYSKDEDHLALITELLGEIPKDIWTSGKMTHLYFTETGGFRNIKTLEQWGLCEVLIEKYRWLPREARDFAEFLHSLLAFDPKQRATASECLLHPWLTGA